MDDHATLEELRAENAQLRLELKRVDAERIEYLRNVSHQLVAPLNAIKWHIENLTGGRVGVERAKKVLRSIYSQATIAVHLAKNFALMSNLEADHMLSSLKEPLQEVDLLRLLINLADDFQPLGWDKDLEISVDQGSFAGAPPVLAMKPLISQVFSNVIENAVKYSDAKTAISIRGAFDREKDSVTVSIQNRGIGIARGEETAVFTRGHRSSRAKDLYPAGTGFGLYIAERIVQLHKGHIAGSTDDSRRTVFTVELPVKALQGLARERKPK